MCDMYMNTYIKFLDKNLSKIVTFYLYFNSDNGYDLIEGFIIKTFTR